MGSDEEYNADENASNIGSGESESDGEIEEGSTSNNDNEFLPITWGKHSVPPWHLPRESQIEKEKIKLKPEFSDRILKTTEPFEILSMLFATDDFWASVHEQTCSYKTWREMSTGKRRKISIPSIQEIKIAFGIIVYMGIVQLPNRRMYWQHGTRINKIADAMPFNRFNDIVSMLHYNDNSQIPKKDSPTYNRCYKIQPLIDHFRERFTSVVIKETFLSIDEQVVPFKGHSSLKRYLKNKPKKWGYKLWAMAGMSGYVYDFEVDGMKGSSGPPVGTNPPAGIGESGFVVLRLTNSLQPNMH